MGTVVDKLNYLAATKDKFMQAMKMLGKDVDELTLREAVNLLYEDAIDRYADSLDVSTLPAYWEESVKDGLRHTLTLGDGYVHHLVTTDNHYNANYRKSPLIMQVLQSTGLYGRVVNLGDITDTHAQAQADNVLADYQPFLGNLLFAIGNHDDFDGGVNSVLYPLIKDDTSLQGSPETFNYYWDDTTHKIRYIVYNSVSNNSSFSTISGWAQGVEDGWSVLILSHYAGLPFMSDYSQTTPVKTTHSTFAKNLEYFFLSNHQKYLAGVISGHEHTDSLATAAPFEILHQAVLNNDGHSNDAKPWPKTSGTDTEQAVTIMSINPTTKDVRFYRIGKVTSYGRSWGYSYATSAGSGHWIPDYWINSNNNFASGSSTTGKRAMLWSTILPTKDADGNAIRYQVYARNNETYPYWWYALATKSDGTKKRYSDGNVSNRAVNFGAGWGSQGRYTIDTEYEAFFVAVEWNSDTISPDNIILTTNPTLEELVDTIGVDFDDAEWINDKYATFNPNSGNVGVSTDAGTATAQYIRVTPGATYRLDVDSEDYPRGALWMAIFGIDRWRWGKEIMRAQESWGVKLPITFTVPNDCGLVCISLGDMVGFTDKVKLEIVT